MLLAVGCAFAETFMHRVWWLDGFSFITFFTAMIGGGFWIWRRVRLSGEKCDERRAQWLAKKNPKWLKWVAYGNVICFGSALPVYAWDKWHDHGAPEFPTIALLLALWFSMLPGGRGNGRGQIVGVFYLVSAFWVYAVVACLCCNALHVKLERPLELKDLMHFHQPTTWIALAQLLITLFYLDHSAIRRWFYARNHDYYTRTDPWLKMKPEI